MQSAIEARLSNALCSHLTAMLREKGLDVFFAREFASVRFADGSLDVSDLPCLSLDKYR